MYSTPPCPSCCDHFLCFLPASMKNGKWRPFVLKRPWHWRQFRVLTRCITVWWISWPRNMILWWQKKCLNSWFFPVNSRNLSHKAIYIKCYKNQILVLSSVIIKGQFRPFLSIISSKLQNNENFSFCRYFYRCELPKWRWVGELYYLWLWETNYWGWLRAL